MNEQEKSEEIQERKHYYLEEIEMLIQRIQEAIDREKAKLLPAPGSAL